MKKVSMLLAFFVLIFLQCTASAQTVVNIKAYGRSKMLAGTGGGSYAGIDVKITTPITCGGTSTSQLRFVTDHSDANGWYQYPYSSISNVSFIAVSEIISAAKNGYSIEIVSTSLVSGVCFVTDYFIHVQ